MSATWHDHGMPSFFGVAPRFSFYEVAEIHQEAPAPYAAAMEEIRWRERMLGAEWFKHNAELAHQFYEMKKPWYL